MLNFEIAYISKNYSWCDHTKIIYRRWEDDDGSDGFLISDLIHSFIHSYFLSLSPLPIVNSLSGSNYYRPKWPTRYLLYNIWSLTSFRYYYLLLNSFLVAYFVSVCLSHCHPADKLFVQTEMKLIMRLHSVIYSITVKIIIINKEQISSKWMHYWHEYLLSIFSFDKLIVSKRHSNHLFIFNLVAPIAWCLFIIIIISFFFKGVQINIDNEIEKYWKRIRRTFLCY